MHFYIKYDKIYHKGKKYMKKINFKLKKDNKIIINENNINCILNNNKLNFILDGIKYTYTNSIFIKETKEEIIELDFKREICKITLKEYNKSINLKINVINLINNDKITEVKYKIETEDNIINIINIEYV